MSETSPSLDTLACPHCGELNPQDANFCQHCGGVIATLQVPSLQLSSSETIAVAVDDLRALNSEGGHDSESLPSAVQHVVAFTTDIGKKHHVNQDAGNAWTWQRSDGTPVSFLAVADGVSAGRHSEDASRLAIDVVYERLSLLLQDPSQDVHSVLAALIEAVKEANHRVASRPHLAVANADATTIVTVFTIGRQVAGAWVGDSRVYRVSSGAIERLTTDHSWAQAVVSRGLMTIEQAARDPRAHMIMRWLGPPDQENPGVDTFHLELEPGDILLCCSDGLYGYFAPPVANENEIVSTFEAHPDDLSGALEELVRIALARGGHDNITAAALQLQGDSVLRRPGATEEIPSLTRNDASQTVRMRFSPSGPSEE